MAKAYETAPTDSSFDLQPEWCGCETVELFQAICMDDFMCPCGIDKHHAQCSACPGICQVG